MILSFLFLGYIDAWKDTIRKKTQNDITTLVERALHSSSNNSDQPSSHSSDEEVEGEQLDDSQGISAIDKIKERNFLILSKKRSIQKIRAFSALDSKSPSSECSSVYSIGRSERSIGRKLGRFLSREERISPEFEIHKALPEIPSTSTQYLSYAKLAEKALNDYEKLNAFEKHQFFNFFTKDAFVDALRTGRLADGSFLQKVDGNYVDRYGIEKDEYGPFWPSDYGPLCPTPKLARASQWKFEPLNTRMEGRALVCCHGEGMVDLKERERERERESKKQYHCANAFLTDKLNAMSDDQQSLSESAQDSSCTDDADNNSMFAPIKRTVINRYSQHLEEFISKYKTKPPDIKYWPYGPYWPPHYYGPLLQTPKHLRTMPDYIEPLFCKDNKKLSIDKQQTEFDRRWRGVQIVYDSEKSGKDYQPPPVASGFCPSLTFESRFESGNLRQVRRVYGRNTMHLHCPLLSKEMPYYMLEWQMEFPYKEDTYYLAHCYPYTYTDLKEDLDNIITNSEKSHVIKREVLCETKAGNSCFLITVTNFAVNPDDKQGVVVTARVHPGESNSSWVMKGVLEFLTSNSNAAKTLRKKFIFKLVPMLNPDGVIVGNYRCSLSAKDLNRNYRHPHKEKFPTIWYTKEMLEKFGKTSNVLIYCDLHGHSRKQNVFMYGCNTTEQTEQNFSSPEHFLKERLFPFLMSRKAPEKFSFTGCKFQIRKCKESTGRVVMFRQMNIQNSFTLEATFSGTTICSGENRHFTVNDYQDMGRVFCETVLEYDEAQTNKSAQTEIFISMTRAIAQHFLETRGIEIKSNPSIKKWNSETNDQEKRSNASSSPIVNGIDKNKSQDCVSSRKRAFDVSSVNIDKLLNETSLKSSDGCIKILENLNLSNDCLESGSSSDSNSESEPELKWTEPKAKRKKKRSKTKALNEKKSLSDKTLPAINNNEAKKKATTEFHGYLRLSKRQTPAQCLSQPVCPKLFSIPQIKELTYQSSNSLVRYSTSDGEEEPKRQTDSLPACSPQRKLNESESDQNSSTESLQEKLKQPIIAPFSDRLTKRSLSSNDLKLNTFTSKEFVKKHPPFKNKYEGRSNGGIPCFSQERLYERSKKRLDRLEDQTPDDKNLLYFPSDDVKEEPNTARVKTTPPHLSYVHTAQGFNPTVSMDRIRHVPNKQFEPLSSLNLSSLRFHQRYDTTIKTYSHFSHPATATAPLEPRISKEEFNRPPRSYHLPILKNAVVPADSAQFLVGPQQSKSLPSSTCKSEKNPGVLINGLRK
ncbi:DgyrCDS3484 [Dimorphilus gyrociliatus]|uniref:DgyrCDS3484 n=1 Tax=Dimorphilus gyrociliatus TaxID=2664684 RepID=A0A7I8VDV1_9ANNE|nr:DgyrCDS3484 [Dimorphilus gyrociliatus]